jgi:hypothetical protein
LSTGLVSLFAHQRPGSLTCLPNLYNLFQFCLANLSRGQHQSPPFANLLGFFELLDLRIARSYKLSLVWLVAAFVISVSTLPLLSFRLFVLGLALVIQTT